MSGFSILYLIESVIPLLTLLLVWAGMLGLKGNIQKHKKVAITHAIATWLSCLLVIILVRMGFEAGGHAPKWLMNIHLVIIYAIPPALVCLMVTGLKGVRSIHKRFAFFYVVIWSGALLTGLMIFLEVKKLV